MSIIWSLKRLFDPQSYYWEEGERHAEREEPERPDDGEPPRFTMAPGRAPPDPEAAHFRCRVCEYTSTDGDYCPACLADTMQAVD